MGSGHPARGGLDDALVVEAVNLIFCHAQQVTVDVVIVLSPGWGGTPVLGRVIGQADGISVSSGHAQNRVGQFNEEFPGLKLRVAGQIGCIPDDPCGDAFSLQKRFHFLGRMLSLSRPV